MVLSKRKRKDNINVPITVQNDVEPKRTRVQAQRKYAQGQPVPTSVYLGYNSEQTTPVKENSNPPVDVLPNMNPSTEDFIKYLCFRNTSMCPKEFEFASSPSTSAGPSTSRNEDSKDGKATEKKSNSKQKLKFEEEPKTSSNSGYIPFAVRKRAENSSDKKKPQTQNANENVKKKKANQKGNKSSNESDTKLNNSEVQSEDKSENNSTFDKEKSGKKRPRIKNADSTNSLNTNPNPKSQKLESSYSNLSDVKIVLEKTDVEKAIEINKNLSNKKSNDSKTATDKNDKNEKRTTRLTTLRNSWLTSETEVKKNNVDSPSNSKQEVEFSSDDEKPLMSSADSKAKQNKSVEQKPTKEIIKPNNDQIDNNVVIEKESVVEKSVEEAPKPKKRGRKKLEPIVQTPPAVKSPVVQLPVVEVVEVNLDESTSPPKEKKKVGRKKKMTADAEIAELSQANTTDLSENEARPGRPSRKTKEAATIYMELIGRKLTLHDFSDNDSSSLDSLELPNFKKMEQMENELKANANKNKSTSDKKNVCEDKIIPVLETSTPKNFSTKPTKTENKKVLEKIEKIEKVEKFEKFEKIEKVITSTPEKKVIESSETKKVNKSFDDSDEEPLATKLGIEKKPPPKKRGRKSNKEKEEMKRLLDQTLNSSNVEKSANNTKITTDIKLNETIDNKNKSTSFSSMFQSPQTCNTINEVNNKKNATQGTSKINQSSENLSKPSNQVTENYFNRLSKVNDATQNKTKKNENDDDFVKGFESGTTKPISLIPKSSINLLPSKEESEKIFGIASVTLAQSSGPLDTKCTLGKCGSIHKPPLGPAVLTESALGANLSPKDRRKSKVNMTREQIQRWLDETSWTPIPDELDELDDIFDPKTKSTSNATTSKKDSSETKDSNVTQESFPTPSTSKGPTLKAKAVAMKKDEDDIFNRKPTVNTSNHQEHVEVKTTKTPTLAQTSNVKQKQSATESKTSSNVASKSNDNKLNDDNKKPKTPTTPKSSLANSDRKPIYNTQQRKKPVYKTVEQKPKVEGSLLNTFGAFSPENEHSVYSFDREDDEIPATAPFRRCSRQESNNSKLDDTPSKNDAFNMFQKPQNYVSGNNTPNKSQVAQSQVSLTLSPEENKKSASISVTQNDNHTANEKAKETNVEKAENDSDSEGHTFYIPLQTTNVSGKNDQLIQGVAVKLGTEGAEGPNQKIIMHAKLVTKSRMGTNSAPLPESMSNVQEIVKTLMANNKDAASKPVPCATVQPRFKTNDTFQNTNSENESMPSTSAMATSRAKPAKSNKNTYDDNIQPVNNSVFPNPSDSAVMVEAPIFRPTEKEFQDPIEYIERIAPFASRFGICKIIPPESFKPECRVSDEMRFTASNQYVHKMLHRWGPSAKEFSAIKKYLATQSIVFQHPPLIAGMEVDLPRLYHTVQELGGLKEVIEKKKWAKVAEDMCIPKSAHDRVTKLDDIYCKYLLPYDTLSHNERQKLFDEVEADWAKREARARRSADKGVESDDQSNEEEEDDSDEDDNSSMECMVKGRSMALSQFFRVARNTMALWFKNTEPSVGEIENEYWRHVAVRDSHVCVHYGSIDSSCYGFGFPTPGPKMKASPCSKHPWNLKVLTNNNKSIIRSLGPVMGVTVPTLHVGMLFSAVCWYRDPHGLPWLEYLHTGANKIWYAIPDDQSSSFRTALTSLVPSLCQNKTIWLPCDTAMVPPYMLTDRNVSLCRTEQEPGQFVVVFSRAYTSSLCTGYTVSESVYFATSSWLDSAHEDFKDIRESSEPSMFSLEQLLFAIANDQRTSSDTLSQILPMLSEVFEKEKKDRQRLKDAGVTATEKVNESKNKAMIDELECSSCRANLYISWIKLIEDEDETIYCLKHALKYLNENSIQANQCRLMYTYSVDDIKILLHKLNNKISSLIQTSEMTTANQGNENQSGKKKGNAKIKHGIATLIK